MITSLLAATMITVTAYCPCKVCCGKWSGGPTASGKMPVVGVTVAASRTIPFGTRVYIPGAGWRTVQDRLARRYDSRMDIYFAKHSDALRWGKRTLNVEVIK
jgi:3D (Asp-Asp-Asp) domain-containing protein